MTVRRDLPLLSHVLLAPCILVCIWITSINAEGSETGAELSPSGLQLTQRGDAWPKQHADQERNSLDARYLGPQRRLTQSTRPPRGPIPRVSLNSLSSTGTFPNNNYFRTLFIRAFDRIKRNGGLLGYGTLAGLHGVATSYNGTRTGAGGFCRHDQSAFGGWHRPYLLQLERGLFQAAQEEARQFTDQAVRQQMLNRWAYYVKVPYWDWTQSTPSLLTARRVTVLSYTTTAARTRTQDIANPLLSFEGTFRGNSRVGNVFGRQVAAFIAQPSFRCTYTTNGGFGGSCAANLEDIHNRIHNLVAGSMADIRGSSYDPIFWPHHTFIDHILARWQQNGGQMSRQGGYQPFPWVRDVSSIQRLGYTYTWQPATFRNHKRKLLQEDDPLAVAQPQIELLPPPSPPLPAPPQTDLSPHSPPGSAGEDMEALGVDGGSMTPAAALLLDGAGPAALPDEMGASAAARTSDLEAYVAELLGGDAEGYGWQLRIFGVSCKQLGGPFSVHVVLKGTPVPLKASGQVDVVRLQRQAGWCDLWFAFSCWMPRSAADKVDIALELTDCLMRSGRNPNTPAADPQHPERGPSAAPVNLSELTLLVLDQQNRDVTPETVLGDTRLVTWSHFLFASRVGGASGLSSNMVSVAGDGEVTVAAATDYQPAAVGLSVGVMG